MANISFADKLTNLVNSRRDKDGNLPRNLVFAKHVGVPLKKGKAATGYKIAPKVDEDGLAFVSAFTLSQKGNLGKLGFQVVNLSQFGIPMQLKTAATKTEELNEVSTEKSDVIVNEGDSVDTSLTELPKKAGRKPKEKDDVQGS